MKGSNQFETAIQSFLDHEKIKNYQLSEALDNENKNITECCDFIIQKVKERKVNAMTNDEVFNLAIEYYMLIKTVKIQKSNCKVVVGSDNSSVPKAKSVRTINKQMSIFDLF